MSDAASTDTPFDPESRVRLRPPPVTAAISLVWVFAIMMLVSGVIHLVVALNESRQQAAIDALRLEGPTTPEEAAMVIDNARLILSVAALLIIVVALFAALAALGLGRRSNPWRYVVLTITTIGLISQAFHAVVVLFGDNHGLGWVTLTSTTISLILLIVVTVFLTGSEAREYFRD